MNMNNKFTFIAELCQNHNGKFRNIEKMLSDCAYNGARVVKLQNIFAKDLAFRPEFENGLTVNRKVLCIKRPYKSEFDRLKKLEINYQNLKNLSNFVRRTKWNQLLLALQKIALIF